MKLRGTSKMGAKRPRDYLLPYPPSVNHYYRSVNGRMLISAEGRAYRKTVAAHVMQKHGGGLEPMGGPLRLTLMINPPDKRRRDLDNTLKVLIDALDKAGVYGDDSQIKHIDAKMAEPKKGGVAVVVVEQIETTEVIGT